MGRLTVRPSLLGVKRLRQIGAEEPDRHKLVGAVGSVLCTGTRRQNSPGLRKNMPTVYRTRISSVFGATPHQNGTIVRGFGHHGYLTGKPRSNLGATTMFRDEQ